MYVIATHGVAVATQFVKSFENYLKSSVNFFTVVTFPMCISYLSLRDSASDKLEVQATRRN